MTLVEVQALDAGQGERVPTLTEVMDLLAGQLRVYVEVKHRSVEQQILDVLATYPAESWFAASFDPEILRSLRKLAPDAELWPIGLYPNDEMFVLTAEIGARGVSFYHSSITHDVVQRTTAEHLYLGVWTVNEIADARRARDLGVAAVCTDYPATIRAGLANRA